MYDNAIQGQLGFSLYLSSRYLKELGVALQRLGIPTRYKGPVVEEHKFEPPRLYLRPDERHVFVCAVPMDGIFLYWCARNPQWWFTWGRNETLLICPAIDMSKAARIIGKDYGAVQR